MLCTEIKTLIVCYTYVLIDQEEWPMKFSVGSRVMMQRMNAVSCV